MTRSALFTLAATFVIVLASSTADAQTKAAMTHHATGTFEVVIQPQPTAAPASAAEPKGVGRMSLDKTFSGELVGTGSGEMLTAMTDTKGSAGYVAVEMVSGTLQGRKGSFMLQHSGSMNRGAPSLVITVVPDSGRGELVGITGQLTIRIDGGKHFYDFEYALP